MSRIIAPNLFGPPGLCDRCQRRCITMDQVGIVCFHCRQGVFMHRAFWQMTDCDACHGACCEQCAWTGVTATPRADGALNLAELRDAWAHTVARASANGQPLPEAMKAFLEPQCWMTGAEL